MVNSWVTSCWIILSTTLSLTLSHQESIGSTRQDNGIDRETDRIFNRLWSITVGNKCIGAPGCFPIGFPKLDRLITCTWIHPLLKGREVKDEIVLVSLPPTGVASVGVGHPKEKTNSGYVRIRRKTYNKTEQYIPGSWWFEIGYSMGTNVPSYIGLGLDFWQCYTVFIRFIFFTLYVAGGYKTGRSGT